MSQQGLAKQALCLHPRISSPDVDPRPNGANALQPGLPRLGVEPAELSEIADDDKVFQVLLGLLSPRSCPEENGE